jgi:hypothetical protein
MRMVLRSSAVEKAKPPNRGDSQLSWNIDVAVQCTNSGARFGKEQPTRRRSMPIEMPKRARRAIMTKPPGDIGWKNNECTQHYLKFSCP